jgi:hypothetical protein
MNEDRYNSLVYVGRITCMSESIPDAWAPSIFIGRPLVLNIVTQIRQEIIHHTHRSNWTSYEENCGKKKHLKLSPCSWLLQRVYAVYLIWGCAGPKDEVPGKVCPREVESSSCRPALPWRHEQQLQKEGEEDEPANTRRGIHGSLSLSLPS